jgi:putative Mg2+ transporter-C (MgtC) family protein
MPSFDGLLDTATLTHALELVLKLGIAAVLGGLIGLEREVHGRPAGIRTHMLICIGVALMCEVSRSFFSPDPSRIAAQVVSGVGFLGAGAILRTGLEVKGLTTAASIWAATAIAMAVSVGGAMYWVAGAATLATLLTLTVVDRLEIALVSKRTDSVLVASAIGRECIPALLQSLESAGAPVSSVRTERTDTGYHLFLTIRGSRKDALAAAASVPDILAVSFQE